MIAAMTADVGIVRIHETRIFPSMDHWTCLQPSDASATAVTAPIWQWSQANCESTTGFLGVPDLDELVPCGPFQRPPGPWHQDPASPSPAARGRATTANLSLIHI